MDLLVEIIKFVGYTAIGFFAGYQVCRMRRAVEEIRDTIVKEDIDETPVETRERLFGDRQSRIIGIVVLLLSTITIVQSAYFTQQNRHDAARDARVARCQAQYNDDFARALIIRGQYADEDRANLNNMIFAILDEPDPKKRRVAVQTWAAKTQDNDIKRKATPLPDLNNRDCE